MKCHIVQHSAPLITAGAWNDACRQPVCQFLVLVAGAKTTAAESDDHIDIVSGDITAPHVTEVFVLAEIRTDIF